MSNGFTVERFIEDIKSHSMTIENENGVHRTLAFKKPDSSHLWFRISTWPGYLAISGDMGNFMWSRLDDMFVFFRDDKLQINAGYWDEKLKSVSTNAGRYTFDEEQARDQTLDAIMRRYEIEDPQESAIKQIIKDSNSWSIAENLGNHNLEDECLQLLEKWCMIDDEHSFTEFLRSVDYDLAEAISDAGQRLTMQYQWCMYAVVWAIQQYDIAKGELL